MKPIVRLKTALALLLAALALTGCWNRRELNTLAIVMGFSIDKSAEGEGIDLTAQIVRADKLHPMDGQAEGTTKAYFNLKNSGADVFSILREDTHQSTRKLYVPYTQMIVFGKELARTGINDYLDIFMRDHEARMNVNLLIADGKASDVMDFNPDFGKIPSSSISQLVEDRRSTSETAQLKLIDYMKLMTCSTNAAVAPVVSMIGAGPNRRARVCSGAVLKQGKLVGMLTQKETRGMLWVTGKVKSGALYVTVGDSSATIELARAKTKRKVELQEDGSIRIQLSIRTKGYLVSQLGPTDLSSEEGIKKLNAAYSEAVQNEIWQSITKARALAADIFEFGESLQQQHSKQWEAMQADWDRIFPKIEVQVQVQALVISIGRLQNPILPKQQA